MKAVSVDSISVCTFLCPFCSATNNTKTIIEYVYDTVFGFELRRHAQCRTASAAVLRPE